MVPQFAGVIELWCGCVWASVPQWIGGWVGLVCVVAVCSGEVEGDVWGGPVRQPKCRQRVWCSCSCRPALCRTAADTCDRLHQQVGHHHALVHHVCEKSDTHICRGSIATYFRWGGSLHHSCIESFIRNLSVEKLLNRSTFAELLLQSFYGSSGFCPELPGWADIGKVKPGR